MAILGCKNNNRISQKDLFQTFYGYAASICNRYVTNNEDLLEVVNDGFLKIYKEIGRFDNDVQHLESRLKSWIRSIMVHTSVDFYRKNAKHNVSIATSDVILGNIEHKTITPIEKISYDEIIALTRQLPPVYKMVFNMNVIDGMNHTEISKALNISEGTSKSNLFKARQIIIKLIEKKYNQPV